MIICVLCCISIGAEYSYRKAQDKDLKIVFSGAKLLLVGYGAWYQKLINADYFKNLAQKVVNIYSIS